MGLPDYYSILNVSENASNEEIIKAFRELAKKLHPDKNKAPDASAKFRELFEAYKILKNEDSRKFYDFRRNKNRNSYHPEPASIKYSEEQYSKDKEQATRTAEECSKMTFDDFLKSSLFMLKKTTINFSLLLMFLFGLFMIGFMFYLSSRTDDSRIAIYLILFGSVVGGLLVYIAKTDFKKKNY